MADAEFLFTVSEVAAAFAGFAGLVTVISQRLGGGRLSEVRMLRNMLLLALLLVLAGLAPYVGFRLGLSEPLTWRVASGAFFLAWLAYIVTIAPSAFRLVHASGERWQALLWYAHLSVHLLTGLLLLVVAIGFVQDQAPGAYLLALLAMLYMVSYLLLRIFLALAGRSD